MASHVPQPMIDKFLIKRSNKKCGGCSTAVRISAEIRYEADVDGLRKLVHRVGDSNVRYMAPHETPSTKSTSDASLTPCKGVLSNPWQLTPLFISRSTLVTSAIRNAMMRKYTLYSAVR